MSDFGGFRGIVEEARALDEENKDRPLLDCPVCGTPLVVRGDDLRDCPLGHFTTRARTWGELR